MSSHQFNTKGILGDIQYPNSLSWVPDGILIVKTKNEIQIIYPQHSQLQTSLIKWLSLHDQQTSSIPSSIQPSLNFNKEFMVNWLINSSTTESLLKLSIKQIIWSSDFFYLTGGSLLGILTSNGSVFLTQIIQSTKEKTRNLSSLSKYFNLVGISEGIELFPSFFQSSFVQSSQNQDILINDNILEQDKSYICCIEWFKLPYIQQLTKYFDENHENKLPDSLNHLLITASSNGTICIWLITTTHKTSNLLNPSLILQTNLQKLLQTLTSNKLKNSVIITSICTISHPTNIYLSTIVFGLSNGYILQVNVNFLINCNHEKIKFSPVLFQQITNGSIDTIQYYFHNNQQNLELIIHSGQVITLIPFEYKILDKDLNHQNLQLSIRQISNNSLLGNLFTKYILPIDLISSILLISPPLGLNNSKTNDNYDHNDNNDNNDNLYILASCLDGTIRLIPYLIDNKQTFHEVVILSHSNILYSTPFHISGLAIDPLGLQFSFLTNTNENRSHKYHQARTNDLQMRLLPWCPLTKFTKLKGLQKIIWSFIADTKKYYFSLSSFYTLMIQAVYQLQMSDICKDLNKNYKINNNNSNNNNNTKEGEEDDDEGEDGEEEEVEEENDNEQEGQDFDKDDESNISSATLELRVQHIINILIQAGYNISSKIHSLSNNLESNSKSHQSKPEEKIEYKKNYNNYLTEFPLDDNNRMIKYRLWQCLHGCIVSLYQYYSSIESSDSHIFLINLLQQCIRVEWTRNYLTKALKQFSILLIEERVNNSEYSNFDSIDNIPPITISQLWFEGINIPSYDESLSIYLASQFLYSFLESYCPINNNQNNNEEFNSNNHDNNNNNNNDNNNILDTKVNEEEFHPFSISEANYLRNLSISIQIYCERIRLLFFSDIRSTLTITNPFDHLQSSSSSSSSFSFSSPSSLSSSTLIHNYCHNCQYCGNNEIISPVNPLRITCSSCTLSIDLCMYTFLPIKLVSTEEDIIKKCLICSACIDSKNIHLYNSKFSWSLLKFSTLLCLFCSSSVIDLFE